MQLTNVTAGQSVIDAGITLARQPVSMAHKRVLLAHIAGQAHRVLVQAHILGLMHYKMDTANQANPRLLTVLARTKNAPKQLASAALHLINAIRAANQAMFHTALHSMELANNVMALKSTREFHQDLSKELRNATITN